MTATPLSVVAGWDLPLLRGAVGTLRLVAERVPAWRAQVEAVGRALESAECWSGPAAAQASQAVVALSAAATAVGEALGESAGALRRVLGTAEEAQEGAAAALAMAAAEGLPLDAQGRVATLPAPPTSVLLPAEAAEVARRAEVAARIDATAAAAREAAAAAGVAAVAAEEALLPLGVVEAGGPVDFSDLLDRLPAGPVPAVPAGPTAAAAAQWWASLSAADQRAAIAASPEVLGGLDGLPAWARDRANRDVLAAALARGGGAGTETAGAVAAEIERHEAAGRQVQLWTLDLDGELAAVAVGDLDTADAVTVLVPGILTTPADDLRAQIGHAADVADRAQATAPGMAVAAMAWIGYRTPSDPAAVLTRGNARRAGVVLDSALDGLAAARTALGGGDPRTTVLAHSYGTVVLDEAADAGGRLAADAVVLLGSPGGADDAAALEAPEVYDAFSPFDPISYSRWFGPDPWRAEFGALELPVDPGTLHWQYYDRDRPTLDALAGVVAGTVRG